MLASSLVISLLLASSQCADCPCVITPGEDLARPATQVPRAYRTAGVVFSGRVVRVDTIAERTVQLVADSVTTRPLIVVADTVRYQVAVDEVWKGSLGRHATVLVPGASTSCGVALDVGASYLLYAYGRPNTLIIDACARVRPMKEAAVDREVLGRARRN